MTSATADRSHLSIGEVLSLLQDDFPDVTISKIRFLESQGLLDPERTPSGYRKFYQGDIERLRWILRHQRDHFLPLKVMKDRLEEAAAAGLVVPPDEPPAATKSGTPSLFEHPGEDAPDGPAEAEAPTAATKVSARERAETSGPGRAARPAPTMPELPVRPSVNPLDGGPTGVSFTLGELADASGLSAGDLDELARYGLLAGHSVAGDTFYDGDALVVAAQRGGVSPLRHRGPPPPHVQGRGRTRGGVHGAGGDAPAQAAQPHGPATGRRQPRRARRPGRTAPLGPPPGALRDYTDLR